MILQGNNIYILSYPTFYVTPTLYMFQKESLGDW